MQVVVFLFYLLFIVWLVTKTKFFVATGLSKKVLVIIFVSKILAGLAYAYFYQLPAYKDNADTYRFFEYSITETNFLLQNPIGFFKDVFAFGYDTRGDIFAGENSYWNDLKSNVIIKILAVCNVFTFKNYYANIIIFNYLFLFGLMAVYKMMLPYFQSKKWLLILSIFFIPSFLFWCSGVHKDGFLFSAMGLVFYLFQEQLKMGFSFKKSVLLLLLMILIFSLRNFIFFGLVVCLFIWFISNGRKRFLQTFLIFYGLAAFLFFASTVISSKNNLTTIIVNKQNEFNALSGGSRVITKTLEPTVASFISYFPLAVDMAFLRPHFSEIKNKSYIPAFVESYLLIIVIILSILLKMNNLKIPEIVIVFLVFSLSILMITGYTITFSGAIVRYKSIVLPFFLTSILYFLDEKKVNFFKIKNIIKK